MAVHWLTLYVREYVRGADGLAYVVTEPDLFFLSFFAFRFSFGVRIAFFCCSCLPLSLLPLSPIRTLPR